MSGPCDSFILNDILENETVCTFFQPIISLKTGSIFAYEALVRGFSGDSTALIAPCDLFARADKETKSVEFDRLCRKKAFETFRSFHGSSDAMMFLNVNTSVIGANDSERPHIGTIAHQMGFDPSFIGLELIEARAHSSDSLIDFVRHYREAGFLIVIDDFGCEQSNIDRLIQIHPDIIKIDRSIISEIETDPYRQSILKSIHSLAEMTGALCLAEGVETMEEIKVCHLLGVDLFQGFAIACPAPDLADLEKRTMRRIGDIQREVHKATMDSIRSRRRLTGDINMLADWLIRQLSLDDLHSMKPVFQEFMAMNAEIECIYLLDASGRQVLDTIAAPTVIEQAKPGIFAPAQPGANHSFKPFYTCFEALGVQRYLTDVYLSLASGNLCRTFSIKLKAETGEDLILCIDFLEEQIRGKKDDERVVKLA